MSEDYAIQFENVFVEIDGRQFIKGIDLCIKRGENFVLFAPSGSGKSFFIRLTLGLYKANRGVVRVNGIDISQYGRSELLDLRENLGTVFYRNFGLIGNMTVAGNISLPLSYHTKMKTDEIEGRVNELLTVLNIEKEKDKRPYLLDSYVSRKVALARALVLNPEILLCDDPSLGLSPLMVRDIVESVFTLENPGPKGKRTNFVAVSGIEHYTSFADRLALFKDGKIRFVGTYEELLSCEEDCVKEFIQKVNVEKGI